MTSMTNFTENTLVDFEFRNEAYTPPASWHISLGTTTHGARGDSTVYALNDTISVDTVAPGGWHIYICTSAGTSAATQPGTYVGVNNEVITDGSAEFTERYDAIEDGTAFVEPSGGGYARVAVTASLTEWAGTQGATSTTASTGTSGTTSNNSEITFGTPTADWQFIGLIGLHDASTAGNLRYVGTLTAPKVVSNGDTAPKINISQLTIQLDN